MKASSLDTINMYNIDERPFGKSWIVWTTRWWQWFLSIPKAYNPAYDDTGERCTIGQSDPNVWFLAGTTSGCAERTITIQAGKAALFPVINVTASYAECPDLRTEQELTSYVESHIDNIVKKEANIDGKNLIISENHRMRSPLFDFYFPADNIYGVSSGYTRGIGDGYWIFLRPLSRGKHNIRTFGSCMSGRVRIGVSIELMVYG